MQDILVKTAMFTLFVVLNTIGVMYTVGILIGLLQTTLQKLVCRLVGFNLGVALFQPATAFHELCHALAATVCGFPITEIKLWITEDDYGELSPGHVGYNYRKNSKIDKVLLFFVGFAPSLITLVLMILMGRMIPGYNEALQQLAIHKAEGDVVSNLFNFINVVCTGGGVWSAVYIGMLVIFVIPAIAPSKSDLENYEGVAIMVAVTFVVGCLINFTGRGQTIIDFSVAVMTILVSNFMVIGLFYAVLIIGLFGLSKLIKR